MIFFLQFLICLLVLHPVLCFDCHSASDKTSCDKLAGCKWTSGACTGSFTPPCSSNPCYFIDPVSGSDIQDGSIQNPFKTLTGGFNALSNQPGSLIIINFASESEVQILDHTTISSSISIKYFLLRILIF